MLPYSFKVCRICSDVLSLFPDTGNLCLFLFFFSLIRLAIGLSILIFSINNELSILLIFFFSVFFSFLFHWFLFALNLTFWFIKVVAEVTDLRPLFSGTGCLVL